jgi:hypothetical protein
VFELLLTHESKWWIGLLAGAIHLAAFWPYIRAILRNEVSPSYISWWVWTVVAIIAAVFYNEAAEDLSAAVIAWTLVFGTVFSATLISIRGGSHEWSKEDVYCIVGVALVLVIWWFYRSAEVGLALIIVVDAIGSIPTVKKSYLNPESENLLGWQMAAVASNINLLATHWTLVDASYPVYIAIMMNAILLALVLGRRRKH